VGGTSREGEGFEQDLRKGFSLTGTKANRIEKRRMVMTERGGKVTATE